jgi:uncharacterized membrane protein YesL
MNSDRYTQFFYKVSNWILKLALINILWILFSILGLVIFGFFPATISMFSVISKLRRQEELPIFKTFWKTYKQEFIKSNQMGFLLVTVAVIFYFDLYFIQETSNSILQLFYYPLIILIFIFCMCILYVFPIYAHYDLKIFQIFKNAFLIMIANPLATFAIISSVIVIAVITMFFPAILLFFSGSILAYLITSAASNSFSKIELKKMDFGEVELNHSKE